MIKLEISENTRNTISYSLKRNIQFSTIQLDQISINLALSSEEKMELSAFWNNEIAEAKSAFFEVNGYNYVPLQR